MHAEDVREVQGRDEVDVEQEDVVCAAAAAAAASAAAAAAAAECVVRGGHDQNKLRHATRRLERSAARGRRPAPCCPIH